MKEIIDLLIAIVISSIFLLGGGYTLKEVHDFVKYEALKKASQPSPLLKRWLKNLPI